MKKIILSAMMLCFAVVVSAQANPEAEKKAQQFVNLENKRVGGTLTEEQQKTIFDAYVKVHMAKEEDVKAAKSAARKIFNATITPEQKAKRTEYLENLKKK